MAARAMTLAPVPFHKVRLCDRPNCRKAALHSESTGAAVGDRGLTLAADCVDHRRMRTGRIAAGERPGGRGRHGALGDRSAPAILVPGSVAEPRGDDTSTAIRRYDEVGDHEAALQPRSAPSNRAKGIAQHHDLRRRPADFASSATEVWHATAAERTERLACLVAIYHQVGIEHHRVDGGRR